MRRGEVMWFEKGGRQRGLCTCHRLGREGECMTSLPVELSPAVYGYQLIVIHLSNRVA
jgi:hypothetical protein